MDALEAMLYWNLSNAIILSIFFMFYKRKEWYSTHHILPFELVLIQQNIEKKLKVNKLFEPIVYIIINILYSSYKQNRVAYIFIIFITNTKV